MMKRDNPGAEADRSDLSVPRSDLRVPISKQRILIVDDKEENLVALRQVLEGVDAEIIAVTNGNDALAATLGHHFSVAILDVMMPGMGGYELAKHLRGDDKTKLIPIVFVTASYADEQHIFEGYEAGAIDYIMKPLDPQVLLGKVRILLEIDRYREELLRHRDRLEVMVGERTAALKERVKEIECLYAISSLVAAPCASIDEALSAAVDLIPPGLQYPGITCAKITYEDREFTTSNFRETPWRLCAELPTQRLAARVPDSILVCHLEGSPERDEGSFLKEERHLINDIAKRIGLMIERMRAEEKQRHLTDVLRALRNVNHLITHEGNRDALLRRACGILTETRGYSSAWIGLHRAADGGMQVAAEAGIGGEVNAVREALACGDWPACCREALACEKTVVIRDPTANCVECPLLLTCRDTSALAEALRHADRDYGVLVVALPVAAANDEQEQSLFHELAGDLGFALHLIEVEAEREESERTIRAIFNSARDGILLADAESGRFVTGNNAICRMLGYSADEIRGLAVADIHPAEALDSVRAKFDRQARGEIGLTPDIPVKRKDGSVFLADVSSAPVRLENRLHVLGIFRDMTEQKTAEVERHQLEDQLRASQKIEAIGSLAGGVAHDFNNLLSVILNYTAFAIDGLPEGDSVRSDLVEVKAAAERAAILTRQLLAFSRRQVLQPVPLDLNQIAAGLDNMLRRIVGEDIDCIQVLAPDLGVVRADPSQIEQVIMNLVVNARDAMPDGGKLTIETSNVDLDDAYAACHVAVKPGPYVRIAVTDTGCGMDGETRARLFEPFFTTKEEGKGTGLGLSTVYGIVKQSGGNVWVYSEPGRGTTFKIYLPRELSATAVVATSSQASPKAVGGTETILVVEDEKTLRDLARLMLEKAGYAVLTAGSGEEALLTCAQQTRDVHLLLTDVVMPQMSGHALALELLKTRPTIKVLYMSGYADNAIVHNGALDPGTHFLGKPFGSAELTRKVRDVLDGGITAPAGGR